MPFQGKRSSRDDKSKKSTRTPLDPSSNFDKQGPNKSDRPAGDRKPYGDKPFRSDRPAGDRKPYGDKPFKSDRPAGDRKPYGDKPFRSDRPAGDRKPYGDKPFKSDRPAGDRKPYGDKSFRSDRPAGDKKPYGNKPFRSDRPAGDRKPYGDKPFRSSQANDSDYERYRSDDGNWSSEERLRSNNRSKKTKPEKGDNSLIRLNRYIANAGICSRRKADELIAAGVVSVNGEAVTELGLKVDPSIDVIRYNGETLKREKMVYVLLNKPKDYITTTDDPQERKTVMNLVEKSSNERIYPVGRLDRNTTGLLLMTNDGDLAEKLSHPRNHVTKIYQVELDKNLSQGDFNKIVYGVELEDGVTKPDAVSYVAGGGKNEIGIQIHSGKNRIVRRIFEHLGYEVIKLDRVVYANLTKKDLPRGRWRNLDEKEIIQLKHLIQVTQK